MTSSKGFSLIELIIVLVITSILAAIAIPSYQSHVFKTRRLDGKVALLDLASRLERYYVIHHSYEQATLAELGSTGTSEKEFYQLQIRSLNATNYMLAAIPVGSQQADTACGTLTLNHLGEKGSGGKVADCWN